MVGVKRWLVSVVVVKLPNERNECNSPVGDTLPESTKLGTLGDGPGYGVRRKRHRGNGRRPPPPILMNRRRRRGRKRNTAPIVVQDSCQKEELGDNMMLHGSDV